jgi:hypothetical protein
MLLSVMIMAGLVTWGALYRAEGTSSASALRLSVVGTSAHQFVLWADIAHQRGQAKEELDLLETSVKADPYDDANRLLVIRRLVERSACDAAAALVHPANIAPMPPGALDEATRLVAQCRKGAK